MSKRELDELREEIRELKCELADREKDLAVFREELTKANQRIEKIVGQVTRELSVAHVIQKILIPTELPHISGFEFSTKFIPSPISGSDYFDIFEHENRLRFGVVLANSTGYSLTALLLSVLLRLTGALEARKGLNPNAMLHQIAKELIPNIRSMESVSLFYGVVDRGRFEMEYSNVGNLVALYQKKNDRQLGPLVSDGPPLSGESEVEFVNHRLSLDSGDRILLGSEGLWMAKNPKGEIFGKERLYKAIFEAPQKGVHDFRNEILYRLENFAQGEPLPKDVTLIVVEASERVLKLAGTSE